MHYEIISKHCLRRVDTSFFCRINRHLSEESFSLGFDRALSVSSYRIECIFPSLARCVCDFFILIVFLNGIFNHSHVIVALMRALLTDSIDVHIAYIINISDQRVSLSLSLSTSLDQPKPNGKIVKT